MSSDVKKSHHYCFSESPFGWLFIESSPLGITQIKFLEKSHFQSGDSEVFEVNQPSLRNAVIQLNEYFSAARTVFDLPLDLSNLSNFTRDVLEMTRAVPWGEVTTYGALALQLGRPSAARAVGAALARNPIPIVIPCHRVIASDGGLGGYSAPGGVYVKERLLELEKLRIRD